MDIVGKVAGGILLIIILAIVFGALLAFPVKWLWNDIVVSIWHLREITATEAWEMLVLCSILFKSSTSSSSK